MNYNLIILRISPGYHRQGPERCRRLKTKKRGFWWEVLKDIWKPTCVNISFYLVLSTMFYCFWYHLIEIVVDVVCSAPVIKNHRSGNLGWSACVIYLCVFIFHLNHFQQILWTVMRETFWMTGRCGRWSDSRLNSKSFTSTKTYPSLPAKHVTWHTLNVFKCPL